MSSTMYIYSFECVPSIGCSHTVIWIVEIKNIEIGVVDDGCQPFQPHFVRIDREPLRLDGSFGDLDQRVHERSLT